MDKTKKEKIVTDLRENLGRAYGTFLVDYKGLNVGELTKLRHELREAGVHFQVVKNKLLLIASEGTDTAVLKDDLTGPCALAITYEDVVTPAKVLTKFMKNYEALEIHRAIWVARA